MPDLRAEWTCDGCETVFRRISGEPFPRPEGWAGDLCIACSRDAEEPKDRARRELSEGKEPSRIMVKGVSKKWMRDTQRELIESGDLDPALLKKKPTKSPKPPKKPSAPKPPNPKRVAAEALLRDDPALSNKEVAERTGTEFRLVARWRRVAGIPNSPTARREEARALLTADPALSAADVKRAMRYPVSTPIIHKVRDELARQATVGSI